MTLNFLQSRIFLFYLHNLHIFKNIKINFKLFIFLYNHFADYDIDL